MTWGHKDTPEEEKARRLQEIRDQTRFGKNVLPLKLEPAPPIVVNEESYSDSSDSEDSDESEKSFKPPTQGEKVENTEESTVPKSSLTSGVVITPARTKPLEFSKPRRDEKKPYAPVK